MPRIEVYTLKQCPYCIRLKSLLDSKGVSYEEIIIGTDERAREKMAERTQGRTSVPQVLLDGAYLGGYDEILDLEAKGELNPMLGLPAAETLPEKVWDVLVIGAGPAGLSAGIYATRKGLACLVISKEIGGQVGETSVVENYLGHAEITGPDLVQTYWKHAQACGVKTRLGEEVIDIRLNTGCKEVLTRSGQALSGRTVVIASGAQKRKLGLDGEERLAGRGVGYCPICEGPQLAGKPVAIVGGGNSSLEAALSMSDLGSHVLLVAIKDELGGDAILRENVLERSGITVYTSHQIQQIQGEDAVDGVVLENVNTGAQEHHEVGGVLIMAGLLPNSSFALDLLSATETGEIHIDEQNQTGVPGVFAAGDVTTIPYKQILVAAGEGAKAALKASDYLLAKR